MTQFTLTIADPKDVSLIKKLLAKFEGVTLKKNVSKRKTGLDEALDDVKSGRVYHSENVDDLFSQLDNWDMGYSIDYTGSFKKDYKRLKKAWVASWQIEGSHSDS